MEMSAGNVPMTLMTAASLPAPDATVPCRDWPNLPCCLFGRQESQV
jgi:hypothetical protein